MQIDDDDLRAGILALRDVDGKRHAVPVSAVKGVHETDGPTVVAVWGQALTVDLSYDQVLDRLGWRR